MQTQFQQRRGFFWNYCSTLLLKPAFIKNSHQRSYRLQIHPTFLSSTSTSFAPGHYANLSTPRPCDYVSK